MSSSFFIPALAGTSPASLVILVVLLFFVLNVLTRARRTSNGFRAPDPGFRATDYSAKPLLTAWELNALVELKKDMPAGFHACPQVRLKDMLDVEAGDRPKSFAPLNRVAAKSVDFAIIDGRGRVALVIELDDKSHHQPERRKSDQDVNAVLRHCRIPLLRVKPGARINVRAHLSSILKQVVG